MIIALGSDGKPLDVAVSELNGGKALQIVDKDSGIAVQIFLTNDSASVIADALNPSKVVVPKGADVMKLIKSRENGH